MNLKKSGLILIYFIFFLIATYLITRQAHSMCHADFGNHLRFIDKMFKHNEYIPHPLWHMSVYYMTNITLNQKWAAVLVTTLFVLLWIYIVQQVFIYFNGKDKNMIYLYLYLFIIFVIGPAVIPPFSKYIVLGTGTPNMWHNVTLIAVKPFALLSLFYTVLALEKEKISYYIVAILSLFISIFAKPSFVIAFLPALFFFILFKRFYSKKSVIFFFILSLVSIISLGYQYLHTYNDGSSSIIISFLGVWSRVSTNVFISIILGVMFPLIYFILNFKLVKRNNFIILTWIMTIISIAYAAFLAESGPRFNHGNFFWSYMISLSLLYVFSIADYFKNMEKVNRTIKIVLNIILAYQTIIGAYYFMKILQGYDPLQVTLF